jgi:hypothetical protein
LIKSISIITKSGKKEINFDVNQKFKLNIKISEAYISFISSFDIEIIFQIPIVEFRNHDYTWVKCDEDRIANQFSPKIIRLKNGQNVQANITNGIWEINKKESTILYWKFNPENAAPLTTYSGNDNKKIIANASQDFVFKEIPSLLFPINNGIEFSRSKIPFSAVACFTDHCDFDTPENLIIQREFFKKVNVKTTKGFFLNHFSKRSDNASFENDASELMKWKEDGHELCYHSLSQSIKSKTDSLSDFNNFVSPFPATKVWIDHGYQPYNFSLFQENKITGKEYELKLFDKNIKILWNYIDSGTATSGVINQLDKQQFTLFSFLKGSNNLSVIKKSQLMIKNIIFHYYNEERLILKYKITAANFKKLIYEKKINSFLPLIKDLSGLIYALFVVFVFWKTNKKKPYKLAKYTPILFKHLIFEKEFYIFQTLEMLDFKKALDKKNIEILIRQKGIFIAHTYFSVPMEYHPGKLFSGINTIDPVVANNFMLLGDKIKNNEIWNPTLSELVDYWSGFENIVLDIDANGVLFVENHSNIIFREILS